VLEVLEDVERDLPQLLGEGHAAGWQSVFVDYHPPYVERLWRPWIHGFRISLHRIYPCATIESLFHPHPWPQAVRVLDGNYEMGVGYGKGDIPPPIAQKIIVRGGFSYEMTDPDGWHYVRPIGTPSLSLMVTGMPWSRTAPKSTKVLGPLDQSKVAHLLIAFMNFYPLR
jgi:hypothetical protein